MIIQKQLNEKSEKIVGNIELPKVDAKTMLASGAGCSPTCGPHCG